MSETLRAERLDLEPFSLEIIDAMLRHDEERLHDFVGARFTGGIIPPLLDDALFEIREGLLASPSAPAFRAWLAIDRSAGEVVGSCGITGQPDEAGRMMIGWSVFERFERKGYATECARRTIRWAFEQPGVDCVRATIPPWNIASIRVAEKLGMQITGEDQDPEIGTVLVYDLTTAVSP